MSDKLDLVRVPAWKHSDGYDSHRLRSDAADAYRAARAGIQRAGGDLTSAGSFRNLQAAGSASRSLYSLHKLGLAFDLDTNSMGLTQDNDPYLCELTPYGWRVVCRAETPHMVRLNALRWYAGKTTAKMVSVAGFELTTVLGTYGFRPIRKRKSWPKNYMAAEVWHFQWEHGLSIGETFLHAAQRLGYERETVLHALPEAGVVTWRGHRFA